MSGQIGSLDTVHHWRRLRSFRSRRKRLGLSGRQRVGDVAGGGSMVLRLLHIIPWQALTHRPAVEHKAPPTPRRRPTHFRRVIDLLLRRDAMRPDLPRRDIERLVAEGVAGGDVDDAHNGDEDAGGNDEAPGGVAEGFLRGGCLVEVAEGGDAEDDHEDAEGDEAGAGGEEGPVGRDVAAEEANFGDYEGHCLAGLVG